MDSPSTAKTSQLWIPRLGEIGAPPGTLIADPNAAPVQVHCIAYGPDAVEEFDDRPADLGALRAKYPVVWIDVAGLGDIDLLKSLSTELKLHSLALEDVINTHQRAKVEPYGEVLFTVLRMPLGFNGRVVHEQTSLFLVDGVVVTFQETPGDCLDPVRERIRKGKGKIRKRRADYLAYALIDAIVDHHFPILDEVVELLMTLEERVVSGHAAGVDAGLYRLKRELVSLRRMVSPLREAMSQLARGDAPQIEEETRIYFRDVQDHTHQVLETIDACRDTAAGLMDLFQNTLAQRTNDVMKVLTMIATVFIPLSFIAGLYGMNFEREGRPWNMPELGWAMGYPLALGVMLTIAIGMLGFFYRKGWLFDPKVEDLDLS